jgi:SPP1 family predicted phage head-tail adaptor
MYNDVITLLSIEEEPNDIGDLVETITRTEVFAEVRSIGMKEKYEALAVGLKPELTFVLADYYDYDNQQAVEYNGIRYKVLRTYQKRTHELEIVVTR